MSVFSNAFYKNPIYKNLEPLSDGGVRNMTSKPAIAKKLFLHGPLHYFYYIHKKWFKKNLVVKFEKREIIELITLMITP